MLQREVKLMTSVTPEQRVGSAGGATSPDAEAGPSERRPRFRLALTVCSAVHVIPVNLFIHIQKNQLRNQVKISCEIKLETHDRPESTLVSSCQPAGSGGMGGSALSGDCCGGVALNRSISLRSRRASG